MKARKISGEHKGIIIGADTIVVLKGKIMGKPGSNKDAVRMLRTLSGNEHKVYTGIAIINTLTGGMFIDYEMTKVKFRRLEKDEINFYVRTNSPMDKAGAYGIQDDFGSTFVEKITGDYFNVVGLPVVKTYLGLKKIMNITL